METEQKILNYVKARGYTNAVKVICTVTILHSGWEMDNQGWVVEMSDKSIKAFTTNHGDLCEWSIGDLSDKIKETSDSLKQLEEVQKILKSATTALGS